MSYRHIVGIDIETTGFSNSDQIIEIGAAAIELRTGKLVTFAALIKPTIPIPLDVSVLTGIAAATYKEEIYTDLKTALVELYKFLQRFTSKIIVAHQSSFEYRFISRECKRLGVRCFKKNILHDTLTRLKADTGKKKGNTLEQGLRFYRIDVQHPLHRALPDAINTTKMAAKQHRKRRFKRV